MEVPDGRPVMMSNLLDCSHEVLHNILSFVQPADLGSLSRSCRSLSDYVRGNKILCRELYLQRFDPPSGDSIDNDWERDLRAIVKLDRMLQSTDEEYKRSCLQSAAETICSLASSPEPARNIAYLMAQFKSRANVDALLTGSSLYQYAGTNAQRPAETPELRQLAAKLHVYFGVPVDQEQASPPVLLPHPTTGPSYQVIHSDGEDGRGVYGDGHYLRSRSRVEIPVNYIARAKVYDLREYTKHSLWGPFKSDGSLEVDWEKVEAIMILMGHNLRASLRLAKPKHTLWYGPWEGVAPGSFLSRHEDPTIKHRDSGIDIPDWDDKRTAAEKARDAEQAKLDEEDPYGVTGTWLRVVCFLDYNDLYAFNFTNDRRCPDRQRGLATDEAIRLICIKVKVTKIVYPGKRGADIDDSDSSSDFDGDSIANRVSGRNYGPSEEGQASAGASRTERPNPYSDRPIVYFTGSSRSLHASWDPNANSRIRGVVQTTPHGDIRWTTWSIFHGEERWRSEGIQVGGAKSSRGVLGNWFDKDYDHYGPAGPTAFWKVSNELDTADRSEGGAASNSLDLLRFLWRVGPGSDDEDDNMEDDDDDNEQEWQDTDIDEGDEDTHVNVEIIDERHEEIEYEFVGTHQDLLDELEELQREAMEEESLTAD